MKGKLPENLVEKVDDFLRKNEIYIDVQTIKHMKKNNDITLPENMEVYVTYFGKKMICAFISNEDIVKVAVHNLY